MDLPGEGVMCPVPVPLSKSCSDETEVSGSSEQLHCRRKEITKVQKDRRGSGT